LGTDVLSLVLAPLASLLLILFALSQSSPCADVSACRQAAVEAATRGDFEAFHDLAWRAAQKGRPNDPELMYLLARAQSLSGRPGDALVMLRRLAQLGVPSDARDNQDFERVRRLPGWADLEALMAAATEHSPPSAAAPLSATATPAPLKPSSAPTRRSDRKPPPAPTAAPALTDAPIARGEAGTTLRMPSLAVNPVGLAYDSASRRFVLGDGDDNKLIVADEVFQHVNDLIGAASAGFGRLSAVEIDTRRGDLWVTSSDGNGAAAIHKLQLVSGRVLSQIAVPAELQPVVLDDLAVTDDGTLVVVDSRGARLFRVKAASGRFEPPVALKLAAPSSIAPANGVTYIAHEGGVSMIETASSRLTAIQAPDGVSLAALHRIRWGRGVLFGIQGEGPAARLVRIRLSGRGRRATAVDILDGDVQSVGTALTFSRDAVYYVGRTDEGPSIRRVEVGRIPNR
jgi:hypothetical protein